MSISRKELLATGILTPAGDDWRVRIVFLDGTERVVRVNPGRLTEEVAVDRAMRFAKIFDRSVVKAVEATRVERSASVSKYGMVQKGASQ